jgi:pyrimidine 5'-nucleotidase
LLLLPSLLQAHGQTIDFDDWHAHVHHTLDYKQLLHEDPQLREMLLSIDLPRTILTNADARHAAYCMERLGITDCFQSIFCFENVMELGGQQGLLTPDMPVLCKPSGKVYELVLQQLGATADATIFIDDSPRNIASAHELGIFTVLISPAAHGPVPGADLVIQHISQLPHALPEIFLDSKQEMQRRVSMEEDPALLALPVRA